MTSQKYYSHKILYKKFTSLLEALDWTISGKIPGIADIWKKSIKNKRYELLIPVGEHVEEWFSAFENALEIICSAQDWNLNEVKKYLLSNNSSSETISLRAFGSLCINNTLPISYANDLHTNFSNIIKNTARKYFSKSKLHKSDKSKNSIEIENFLNNIRLAPSTPGSFIINIEIPLEINEFSTDCFTGISHDLQNFLKEVIVFSDVEDFKKIPEQNLDPKICNSLYKLGGLQEDQDIEIIFTKFSIKSKNFTNKIKFKFGHKQYSRLRILNNFYKTQNIPIERTIIGYVIRLDKDIDEENGFVYIKCRIDEKDVKLRINLDGPFYQDSIHAHKERIAVSFSCEVTKFANRWFGDNVKKFKLLSNNTLI